MTIKFRGSAIILKNWSSQIFQLHSVQMTVLQAKYAAIKITKLVYHDDINLA